MDEFLDGIHTPQSGRVDGEGPASNSIMAHAQGRGGTKCPQLIQQPRQRKMRPEEPERHVAWQRGTHGGAWQCKRQKKQGLRASRKTSPSACTTVSRIRNFFSFGEHKSRVGDK